jgi:membrane associated rhomboid family serine protease
VLPIPIGDENPTRRRAYVNFSLIALNGLFFVWFNVVRGEGFLQLTLEDGRRWGLLPGHPTPVSFLTAMFLHGSPWHLLGNMWFLHLFGDNVEDKLGRAAYLVLYLGWGCLASGAFLLFAGGGSAPLVGASGAISGVMGAYVVFFPRARIRMIWWLLVFILPFALPAIAVVGMYLLQDVFLGLLGAGRMDNVAHAAHIGGMLTGIATALVLKPWLRRGSEMTAWDRDTGFAPGGGLFGPRAGAGAGPRPSYEVPRTFPLPDLRDQLVGAVLDGRMDLALELHRQWRERPRAEALPPGVDLEIAHEVLRRGRIDDAEAMYRAFLKAHPSGDGAAEARFRLGLICARARGELGEARELLRRAAGEHPDPETRDFARRELERL